MASRWERTTHTHSQHCAFGSSYLCVCISGEEPHKVIKSDLTARLAGHEHLCTFCTQGCCFCSDGSLSFTSSHTNRRRDTQHKRRAIGLHTHTDTSLTQTASNDVCLSVGHQTAPCQCAETVWTSIIYLHPTASPQPSRSESITHTLGSRCDPVSLINTLYFWAPWDLPIYTARFPPPLSHACVSAPSRSSHHVSSK